MAASAIFGQHTAKSQELRSQLTAPSHDCMQMRFLFVGRSERDQLQLNSSSKSNHNDPGGVDFQDKGKFRTAFVLSAARAIINKAGSPERLDGAAFLAIRLG